MTLSKKTYCIVCAAFLGLIAVLSFVTSNILWKGFDIIENNSTKNHVERILSVIDFEYENLVTTAGDYAGWDDTYDFVQNRNEAYVKSNLIDSTFTQLQLDMIIILDRKGEVVYATGYDRKEGQKVPLSPENLEHFRAGSYLARHENIESSKKGILSLKTGGVIVASRPILTSSYSGPIMGTFIMGRNLDEEVLKRWSNLTRTSLSLQPVGNTKEPLPAPSKIAVQNMGCEITEASTPILDIYGEPAYLLRVRMPRNVHQQAHKTIQYLAAAAFIVFLVFAFAIIWLLKKSIITRMISMGREVNKIGMDADFSARVRITGKDELTGLGKEINGMLEKLEESTHQLTEAHNALYQTNQVLLEQIEEKKRSETELRKSEEKYRLIFEYSPLGHLFFDEKGVILACNDKFVQIIGSSRKKLIGLDMLALPDKNLVSAVQKALDGGAGFYKDVYHSVTADKSTPVRGQFAPMIVENGLIFGGVGIFEDITEQKRAEEEKRNLEERLQRAEKMESLGILAGGVAHDLNNVLGIVVGYAELLLLETDASSPIRPRLMGILKGGQRSAAIVQDLLTLARRGVSGRDVVNLNSIISDCRKSPEFDYLSSLHSSIQVRTELEPDLLNISGSSVHLGKTIFNLVSNANEAMPEGGVLTIKTVNQYLERPIYGYDEIREGDYAVLSVSDTGEGIDATDLKRIFEPFYTRKVMGRSGTGLGLAVVWGTVKDHNGYINVQSEKGKGSTFTLYFPVTREEVSAENIAVSISEYMGNGESILVVDDVKGQRDLAAAMLRKLNYKVFGVSSGEEAVAFLKERRVDLMVLDMIMEPGIDGLDTYRRVVEIYPAQKAIIVSGFSESDRVKTAQSLGAGAYVKKPYILEKLGTAVWKELKRVVAPDQGFTGTDPSLPKKVV